MKSMDKIISKDMFVNAYEICKSYAESPILNDINLLLLKNDLINLSVKDIQNYYELYIKKDIFYGNPVLFANDIVHIPKGLDDFREYRFFDVYSMILYNAVGLLFYKICNTSLSRLALDKDNIFKFVPTVFIENSKSKIKYSDNYIPIKANKDYRDDYSRYLNKLKEKITKNKCLIKIDLSRYFDSIPHDKLISLLNNYSLDSTLAEYDIDKESIKSLNFYFESMMNNIRGIPQGRDNCFSDYFGDIYLRQFDFAVKHLCENEFIKFNSMVRYVDDITIVFEINDVLDVSKHYKIMSSIVQKISRYFLDVLEININSSKTKLIYFSDEDEVEEYLNNECKKVSTKNSDSCDNNLNDISKMYSSFINTLKKFKFCSDNKFNFYLTSKDREILKYVFNSNFKNYLCIQNHIDEINSIIECLDLELTADNMYILIILFFLESCNKKIYFNSFKYNVNKNLDLLDKRTIHIAMMCYTQQENLTGIRNKIKKSLELLKSDNYGKYLIPLSNYYNYSCLSYLDEMGIYNIISCRYSDKSKKRKFLPISSNSVMYNLIFDKFCNLNINDDSKVNEAQIQQLVDFVYYYRKGEWNLAYNSFYNFFHESCKILFLNNKKSNTYDINNIISDLYKYKLIDSNYELLLNKFADSRNFNSISHPSKNGKKSIKVSKEKLEYFVFHIGNLLCKLFD